MLISPLLIQSKAPFTISEVADGTEALAAAEVARALFKAGADLPALALVVARDAIRAQALEQALAGYTPGTPVVWVQEEPENMGAWRFMKIHFGEKLFDRFPFSGVCRQSAASPATGSKKSHDMEQNELLSAAFTS